MWGSFYRTARGRRQEDPGLSERPIGVLGMGEGQRQNGRQISGQGPAPGQGAVKEDTFPHWETPQVASWGNFGTLRAVKWRVLKGKRRIYLGDQAAWPCQGSPNTGPAPLRKHVAAWWLPASSRHSPGPRATEPPGSRPRTEACEQKQAQGHSKAAGGRVSTGKTGKSPLQSRGSRLTPRTASDGGLWGQLDFGSRYKLEQGRIRVLN